MSSPSGQAPGGLGRSGSLSVHSSASPSQGWKDKPSSVLLGLWAASVLHSLRGRFPRFSLGEIVLHFLSGMRAAVNARGSTQRNPGSWLGDGTACPAVSRGPGSRGAPLPPLLLHGAISEARMGSRLCKSQCSMRAGQALEGFWA